MRWHGRAATVVAPLAWLVLLAACTTLPKPGNRGETLSGRLSVRLEAAGAAAPRSLTAAFELQGNAHRGSLDLSTPLGTTVAQARWTPQSVVLATPRGEKDYPDLDALTHDVLGDSIPVAALFDWLRGRPWPGAASSAVPLADGPGFEQLGWIVSLARFDDAWVIARREQAPSMTVRVKLDRR